MPATSILDGIRAALRGKSDVPLHVLAESLDAATDARNGIVADVDAARSSLEAATFETDAIRAKLRAALNAALERLADAEDLVAGISMQHASAQHAADEAARMSRALEARANAKVAADKFARDWRRVETLMLDTLEALYKSELQVDQANLDLPFGVGPIDSVEFLARVTPGVPTEVLEDGVVDLWIRENESVLPDSMQPEVEDIGGGHGRFVPKGGGPVLKCFKRRFHRRRTQRGSMPVHPAALLPSLTIPSFSQPGRDLISVPKIAPIFMGLGDSSAVSMAPANLEHVRRAREMLNVRPEPARLGPVDDVITPVDDGEVLFTPLAPAATPDEPVDDAVDTSLLAIPADAFEDHEHA